MLAPLLTSGQSLASPPRLAAVAPAGVITVSPGTVVPTGGFKVTGSGFVANQRLELFVDSANLGSTVTDPSGGFGPIGLEMPSGAAAGSHWVSAVDSATHRGSQRQVLVRSTWLGQGNGPGDTAFNAVENRLNPDVVGTATQIASASAGGSVRGVAVAAGVLYTTSGDGTVKAFSSCISGACPEIWSGSPGGSLVGSPALAGQNVLVGSDDGNLSAFRVGCGSAASVCSPAWQGNLGAPIASSPVIGGASAYVTGLDGTVAAFSTSGCGVSPCAPRWRITLPGPISAAPALLSSTLYVPSLDGSLYALDTANGAVRWFGPTGGQLTASPAVLGRTAYVGSVDGYLYAFPTACGSGGVSCSPSWRANAGSSVTTAPALAYNEVYVGSQDGTIHAWSTLPCPRLPCEPSWTAALDGSAPTSLAVADGLVYAATTQGSLYGLAARGLQKDWITQAGATVQSSPAIVNSQVLLGVDDGLLHIYGLSNANPPSRPAISSLRALVVPIRHIVVIYQENHSFDNLFGVLCVIDQRCDGAESGQLANGTTIALPPAGDIPPDIPHSVKYTNIAIDAGKMDGYSLLTHCDQSTGYQCYQQYQPSQIPNLSDLARQFVVSDRTFQLTSAPSWGGHLDLVAGQLDGFTGDNPPGALNSWTLGWGCDANQLAPWQQSPSSTVIKAPSCVPWTDGSGPFTTSPVASIPTIMTRLDQEGYSWRLYTGDPRSSPRWLSSYIWAICPTFAQCLYSADANNMMPAANVVADAQAGALPSLSLVQPSRDNSQHNGASMLQGDNWIGSVVSAIEQGPDWKSTAIFITYDDCGCFYDHVAPAPGLSIRTPMVIVSPYARPTYTDSNVSSFASILAYIEHTLAVPSLGAADTTAYDYHSAFDYSQAALVGHRLESHKVPRASRRWMRLHRGSLHDPT